MTARRSTGLLGACPCLIDGHSAKRSRSSPRPTRTARACAGRSCASCRSPGCPSRRWELRSVPKRSAPVTSRPRGSTSSSSISARARAGTRCRPAAGADARSPRCRPPSWPVFLQAIGDAPVGALYAFPLGAGFPRHRGRRHVFRRPGRSPSADNRHGRPGKLAALQVLRRTLSAQTLKPEPRRTTGTRGESCTRPPAWSWRNSGSRAADALLVIHGYAFSHGRSVREVAVDIVGAPIGFHLTFERDLGWNYGDPDT